jgi:hypothetical protein
MDKLAYYIIIKKFEDKHWPWPLTDDEGGEVAEEAWHETRLWRAGEPPGEDTQIPENFPGNRVDRRRWRPEEIKSEEEREALYDAIGEQ